MKYVFTDLDGTLLTSTGLKQKTIDACLEYQKSNKLILSTGRNETSVQEIAELLKIKENKGACILMNGLELIDYEDNERRILPSFNKQEAKMIVRWAYILFFRIYLVTAKERYAYHVLYEYLFYIARWIIKHKPIPHLERVKEFPDGVLKIELCPTIFFQFFLKLFKKRFEKQYEIVLVSKYWVEIIPKGVNKANMVQYYIDKYHLNVEDIYVFGDGENDIEMLKMVKHSYAMENASEKVKECSYYICESNDEFGVIKVLQKLKEGEHG